MKITRLRWPLPRLPRRRDGDAGPLPVAARPAPLQAPEPESPATPQAMLAAICPPPLRPSSPHSIRAHEHFAALCSLSPSTAAVALAALTTVDVDAAPQLRGLMAWKGCLLRLQGAEEAQALCERAAALAPRCAFSQINAALSSPVEGWFDVGADEQEAKWKLITAAQQPPITPFGEMVRAMWLSDVPTTALAKWCYWRGIHSLPGAPSDQLGHCAQQET